MILYAFPMVIRYITKIHAPGGAAGAGGDPVVLIMIGAITAFFLTGWKWWLYVALIDFILWIEKTK